MIVGGALVSLAFIVVATGTLLHWSYDVAPDAGPVSEVEPVDPYTLRSAQQGDAEAQFRIARILLSDPVPDRKNASEAVRWLTAAAEQDHTGAMVQLGKLYRSGVGVLQNFGNAAKWIETAAVLEDPAGMHELGRLYRDGVGFDRDAVKAYIWFSRSAAAFNTAAVRDRDDVARGLSDEQLEDAQRKSAVAKKAPAGDGAGEPGLAGKIKLSSTEETEKNGTTE
ncbi:tetratricopeptide repeat protein [Aromatoleum sp.]|uniref:tetratricopeptide repeat protein n=1 Tax=Aromatoleum sp. TaxID=2307007 RepID=UPI002FC688BA